jgi:predicted phosphohydrolase
MNKFIAEKGFKTIKFLHNNFYNVNNYAICGTRGWAVPSGCSGQYDDEKIYQRELQRLELSLKSAVSQGAKHIICGIHFPPFRENKGQQDFIDIFQKYNVEICIYGHIHGNYDEMVKEGLIEGTNFKFVSCEKINFTPVLLAED